MLPTNFDIFCKNYRVYAVHPWMYFYWIVYLRLQAEMVCCSELEIADCSALINAVSNQIKLQDMKGLEADKLECRLYVGNLDFRISEWVTCFLYIYLLLFKACPCVLQVNIVVLFFQVRCNQDVFPLWKDYSRGFPVAHTRSKERRTPGLCLCSIHH